MKKILFTSFFIFTLIACNTKKSNKNTTETKELPVDVNEQGSESTKLQGEEKIRSEINTQYRTELKECLPNVHAVTDFNGKIEFWKICNTEQGKKIIQINSHENTTLYEEVYFEQNGQLIYAEESIKYMPINHFVLQPWTCKFYAENGKLISLISIGHGKTENDEWNPEIIFDMYKNRTIELNRIEGEKL